MAYSEHYCVAARPAQHIKVVGRNTASCSAFMLLTAAAAYEIPYLQTDSGIHNF